MDLKFIVSNLIVIPTDRSEEESHNFEFSCHSDRAKRRGISSF